MKLAVNKHHQNVSAEFGIFIECTPLHALATAIYNIGHFVSGFQISAFPVVHDNYNLMKALKIVTPLNRATRQPNN